MTTTSLPLGTLGSGYNGSLVASGGVAPYTWSLSGGNLPPGLSLSAAGVISGTPTSVGTFNFTARVGDSSAPATTIQAALTIVVVPPRLSIIATALPSFRLGIGYSVSLTANGGTPPYTWSLVSGSLPAGLSLSGTGVLSGTPTSVATSNFTVQLADSSTPVLTSQLTLTAVVVPPPLAITAVVPTASQGINYTTSLVASGGAAPYAWSLVSGNLPPGLNLSSAGVISGTPSTIGSYSFTVQAADSSVPPLTTQGALSIIVTYFTPAPISVISSTLPIGKLGVSYNTQLVASGGVLPYSWYVTGGYLPSGVGMTTAGVLSGTPTSVGTFTFTVQVRDVSVPAAVADRSVIFIVLP